MTKFSITSDNTLQEPSSACATLEPCRPWIMWEELRSSALASVSFARLTSGVRTQAKASNFHQLPSVWHPTESARYIWSSLAPEGNKLLFRARDSPFSLAFSLLALISTLFWPEKRKANKMGSLDHISQRCKVWVMSCLEGGCRSGWFASLFSDAKVVPKTEE